MNKTTIILLLILLGLPFLAQAAIKTMATDKFMIYYRSGMEDEAFHALQVLEYYRPRLEQMVGNDYPRAAIKLEDMGNLVNGFANPAGNVIGLFMYPPTNDELSFGEDWFQIVAPHEYIHQLQISYESGLPELIRTLFGNLFYVQMHQPMWMTEGITVYGESQLSDFAGRMNSAYYSALISALAREDKLPSPTKASYFSYDTPLAHYYVFGGSFHRYLAKAYGEDKFAQLYRDNSSRIAAYSNPATPALALDPAFNNTFGKPLETLWTEWQQTEKASLMTLNREQMTKDGWGKGNLGYHNGALYYTHRLGAKTGPGRTFSIHRLMKLDVTKADAVSEVIISQATGFPAGYQVLEDRIYFSRNEYYRGFDNKENEGFGAITQILLKDFSGTRIIYQGQVRAFVALQDGRIIIAEDKPLYRGSTLFEYDYLTGSKKVLYDGDHLIHGVCTHNEDIYVNAKGYWSNSGIFKLENGRFTTVVNSPSSETMLFIQDSKLYYNAVFNDEMKGFVMDLKKRETLEISSGDYLKNPIITEDNRLFYLGLNSLGADIYEAPLSLREPKIPDFKRNPPPFPKEQFRGQSEIFNGKQVVHGDYGSNIGHMMNPRILRLPQIQGSSVDSLAIGAVLVGMDAVGDIPYWMISGIYDSQRKKVIGDFSLSSTLFSPVNQDLLISTDDNLTVMLNSSVALWRRQNYGFNSVNAGLGIKTWDDFERKLAYPFVSQQFSWLSGQLNIRNSMFLESSELKLSDRERLGWQGQMTLRQRLTNKAEFNSILNVGYDPDAPSDEVFYPIRGYSNELYANKGFTLRNTLYMPVLKVREGLWNPQIYLEDIHLGLFYDLAKPEDKLSTHEHHSYGAEIIGELGMAFQGILTAGMRVGKTKTGETFAEMILGLDY